MQNSYIHYVPRRVYSFRRKMRLHEEESLPTRTEAVYWFADGHSSVSGFARPEYHITGRKTGPAQRIYPGDLLWIIGQLKTPWGNLTASLDAMLLIDEVIDLPDGRRKFIASEKSLWFPLADVEVELRKLKTVSRGGKISTLIRDHSLHIGHSLQSIRRLHCDEPLRIWSEKVLSSEAYFISYRLLDGTKRAYLAAKELIDDGRVVFWDKWALPRRLSERREYVDDETLHTYLERMIKVCHHFKLISTFSYFEKGCYAQKEFVAALSFGKNIVI